MKKAPASLAAAVMVLTAVVAGCTSQQQEAEQPTPSDPQPRQEAATLPPKTDTERTDEEIAKELRGKIEADSQLSNYDITVEVKDNRTSITGAVPNRMMKDKIDLLASTVAGQAQTMNEVTITYTYAPPVGPRSDAEIKHEMQKKMDLDSELSEVPISLEVVDRTIMLTGVVPSERIRKKAGDLARTVAGAERIENQLQVKRLARTKTAE